VGRWQRYWFADGGRVAAAYVRVAIAMSVLLTLERLATLSTVQLPGPPELYRPVGIWMLLGGAIPPEWLITLLWVAAWGGTIAMLLGLATRVSTVVSFVGASSLAALSFASTTTWSHQYNVVFLAQLAFLGARGGDTLSLDALIRRMRGLPQVDVPRGYQWSLRLVQLAIALMFAGAVFHKLAHGQFTLRWALSDNLRHHLLLRYDLAGLERPEIVNWLLEESWRWRAAALGNMVAQLLPIFACVFVRRPFVRLCCGTVWGLEVIGLGLVMSLWNEHWLPLVAVFVDWDRLNHWLLREPVPAEREARPRMATRVWIVVFVVYEAVTSFVPTLDQRLNTYPFSGFPMFAKIRLAEPYDEHVPYGVPGDKYEVIADRPIPPDVQRWFDHANRNVHAITSAAKLEARLRAIVETAQQRNPELGIRGVRHHLTIFETAAYPGPARFEPYPIAITGELVDGVFRSMLGKLDGRMVVIAPVGIDAATVRLAYYANDRPVRFDLAARRDGLRFAVELAADPAYIVVIANDTAWLVATRRSWTWQ
jgi:hypothetical protein